MGTARYHDANEMASLEFRPICPTCHSVAKSRACGSFSNAAKAFLNLFAFVVSGTLPLTLSRRCNVCNALFTPSFIVRDRVCWQCGYPRQGLPLPRCPECGTRFEPDDETLPPDKVL